MDDKLIIQIDVTDYRDEALRDELIITNEENVIDALQNGIHTAKVARATIASREMKLAPEDIIRPNRALLTAGAIYDVITIAHKQKSIITTKSGKEYEASTFVGRGNIKSEDGKDLDGESFPEVNEDDVDEEEIDKGPSFVTIHDPLALERSNRYLRRKVPGYIWGRLLVIYKGGGDVIEAASWLKANIDEMVNRLMESVPE